MPSDEKLTTSTVLFLENLNFPVAQFGAGLFQFCLECVPVTRGRGRVPSVYPHAGYASRIESSGPSVCMGTALTPRNAART